MTEEYLNRQLLQQRTTTGFTGNYERDLAEKGRINFIAGNDHLEKRRPSFRMSNQNRPENHLLEFQQSSVALFGTHA
jgi:hypothetical protein